MREILFKAKYIIDGSWVFGSYLYKHDSHFIVTACGTQYAIYPETLCQYTGIHDKKGALIYDRDNVKYDDGEESGEFEVRWWEGGFVMAWDVSTLKTFSSPTTVSMFQYFSCSRHLEVIGNIYDNEADQ